MRSNNLIIFNFISFQLLWWACVLSAGAGLAWQVLILVVLYTAAHLQWVESWQQALPLLVTAAVGSLFDQIGYSMGWISFNDHHSWISHIPLWMIALWLAFACTLNVSMRWLQCKPLLAAVLGGIFGPLAYLGAVQLGAVGLPSPGYSLAWVALEWAIAMPLLLWVRYAFNQTVAFNHTVEIRHT
ncbi:DUF2878 domain-containing protein [Methylophilus sp.]|uniref:DUF2878 domain-containing protein n=1 Tax=Methylophilus sp. TaxID=29541 RepID=UPI0040350785